METTLGRWLADPRFDDASLAGLERAGLALQDGSAIYAFVGDLALLAELSIARNPADGQRLVEVVHSLLRHLALYARLEALLEEEPTPAPAVRRSVPKLAGKPQASAGISMRKSAKRS